MNGVAGDPLGNAGPECRDPRHVRGLGGLGTIAENHVIESTRIDLLAGHQLAQRHATEFVDRGAVERSTCLGERRPNAAQNPAGISARHGWTPGDPPSRDSHPGDRALSTFAARWAITGMWGVIAKAIGENHRRPSSACPFRLVTA